VDALTVTTLAVYKSKVPPLLEFSYNTAVTFVEDPVALSNKPPRLLAADAFISTLAAGLVNPNPVLPALST
jgi:hypothetical protein